MLRFAVADRILSNPWRGAGYQETNGSCDEPYTRSIRLYTHVHCTSWRHAVVSRLTAALDACRTKLLQLLRPCVASVTGGVGDIFQRCVLTMTLWPRLSESSWGSSALLTYRANLFIFVRELSADKWSVALACMQ